MEITESLLEFISGSEALREAGPVREIRYRSVRELDPELFTPTFL